MLDRPKPIKGLPGNRVKVFLGKTGDDYLLILDHEDEDGKAWQVHSWSSEACEGGIPSGVLKQLNNLSAKDRYAKVVALGPKEEWYVHGIKRDGSGSHCWWGGTAANIKEHDCDQLAFGDNGSWLVIDGSNGYQFKGIRRELQERIRYANESSKSIRLVRLLPHSNYFVSDDEGTAWSNPNNSHGVLTGSVLPTVNHGKHLLKLLKRAKGSIQDLAVSRDGMWIVILPDTFHASEGVSSEVTNTLRDFYNDQHARQAAREVLINAFDEKIAQQEELARRDAERKMAQERAFRARQESEFAEAVQHRRLRAGMRITITDRSRNYGDCSVLHVEENSDGPFAVTIDIGDGHFRITRPKEVYKIIPFSGHEDDDFLEDFDVAARLEADKYLVAAARSSTPFSASGCAANETCAVLRPAQESLRSGVCGVSWKQEQVKKALACRNKDDTLMFDEYKCIEKVSRKKLQSLLSDLRSDRTDRDIAMEWLERQGRQRALSKQELMQQKELRRCKDLETIAENLNKMTSDLIQDRKGCIYHDVEYKHSGGAFRGRLFAVGPTIDSCDDERKCPPTVTLQGMIGDLRCPLVGSFAYDTDCENSEIRLVCSLAIQMQLEDLIPTFFDYRDNRQKHLRRISKAHNVSEDMAKRLPNIIVSGGRYETWLRKVSGAKKASIDKETKFFCFELRKEILAFWAELEIRPRFQWLCIERRELLAQDPKIINEKLGFRLMSRIIESSENEVLGLVQGSFFDTGWHVRAKIFDGLIVEPGTSKIRLEDVFVNAQATCNRRGWHIKLVEKPLHGKHDDPLPAIVDARAAKVSVLSWIVTGKH